MQDFTYEFFNEVQNLGDALNERLQSEAESVCASCNRGTPISLAPLSALNNRPRPKLPFSTGRVLLPTSARKTWRRRRKKATP